MEQKHKRLRALQRQIARLERQLARLHAVSRTYTTVRLLLFLLIFAASGMALFWMGAEAFGLVLGATILAFAVAVGAHRRVESTIIRYTQWRSFKQTQIARMTLDWERIPPKPAGERQPLEIDLDLAGQRSLHQLLDTAVSQAGSRRLRDWLSTPIPDLNQIAARQALIRELTPATLWRQKLLLNARLATETDSGWSADQLTTWLQAHPAGNNLRLWVVVLGCLAVINIALASLHLLGVVGPLWQWTLGLYLLLSLLNSRAIANDIFAEAAALQDAFRQLTAVFRQLETHAYARQPYLRHLCAPFLNPHDRPSHYLKRLSGIVSATSLRRNPFFWLPLNLLIPWDFYFAYRLARCKTAVARRLPTWLDVWFELEALNSLANFAYLNPHYTFPSVARTYQPGQDTAFEARAIGHPLLPAAEKICNDFTLHRLREIGLITGSNMAGKSTFLRTIGVNLALAYAGSVVNADRLETLPFRLFSAVKVSDSVVDGISYFYAEVKRLRALLDELARDHWLPLFFLIDEIFRGTNNRERLIGSRAYITALSDQYGVGLISTHDLELVQLAELLPGVVNYHFREEVIAGRMVFDYILRPGPSPTTNALKIMQREGLPVSLP